MRVSNISDVPVNRVGNHVQQIITSIRDSESIALRLAERGIDAATLDALQDRLDAFTEAVAAFNRLDGEKQQAAQDFTEAVDAFRRGPFRDHVSLAEAAFSGESGPRRLLGLDNGIGNVNTAYADWLSQAVTFYDELQSTDRLQDALAEVNLTPEELQAGADEVARLDRLHQSRNDRDAERQQARRDRDAQRVLLETELRRLQKIGRVALRDTPDDLEKLGFTVPS
jgi:hypothetical protein